MRKRIAVLVTVLAVVVGACGSDGDDDGDDAGATTTTAAAGSATTATTSAATAAQLAKLVLVASDFPTGWTASAPDPDDDSNDGELEACAGASPPEATIAELDGQEFANGQNQILSEVSMSKDDAAFAKDVAALKSSKYAECLKTFLGKEIADDVPAGGSSQIDVANLDAARHGDVTVGYRVTVSVTANGQTLKLFADAVAMGKKRLGVTMSFLGFGAPVDETLRKSLVEKLGKRLDAA